MSQYFVRIGINAGPFGFPTWESRQDRGVVILRFLDNIRTAAHATRDTTVYHPVVYYQNP